MRYAMLFFALLGAAGAGFLGNKWVTDLEKGRPEIEKFRKMEQEMGAENVKKLGELMGKPAPDPGKLEVIMNAGYTLMGGAVVGLVVAALTFARVIPGVVGGLLLVVAGAAPAVFEPKALVFSGALILAGLFAFFVRPKRKARPTSDPDTIPAGTDMVG